MAEPMWGEGSAEGGATPSGNKISKTIGWLNNMGGLQSKILYDEVAEALSAIGEAAAGKLLHEISANGGGFANPTQWLKNEAEKLLSQGGGARESAAEHVAWLNSQGGLLQPIQYDDVADLLAAIGEAAAGKLLHTIAEKAATIRDPTSWLKVAAQKQLPGGKGGSELGISQAGKGGSVPGGDTSQISQTVEWLNNQGSLCQPIRYDEVAELLSAIGDAEATRLLQKLSGKAATIKEPTGWLASAAKNLLSTRDGGGSEHGGNDVPFPEGYISQTVDWLNRQGVLWQPIRYAEVAEVLAAIGDSAADKLLRELAEKANSIRDPTGWLKVAAKTQLFGGKSRSGSASPRGGKGELASGGQTSQTIDWLNMQGTLWQPIRYDDVAEDLAAIGEPAAEKLLHQLSLKADTIKEPTGWLKVAARKTLSGGGGDGRAVGENGAISSSPLDDQTRQTIQWLNTQGVLWQPLQYDDVAEVLASLGAAAADKLLQELSEKAAVIKNPTGWLKVAAQKQLCEGDVDGEATSGQQSKSVAEEQLGHMVEWLNNQGTLCKPVQTNDVVEVLAAIGVVAAEKLLNDLSEKGASIKEPTGWLLVAARKQLTGANGQGERGSQGTSPKDYVSKTIGWMNKQAGLAQPINYTEVAGMLGAIGESAAKKILQDLTTRAATVRDPTGWLKTAAGKLLPSSVGGWAVPVTFSGKGARPSGDKISKTIGWLNKSGKLLSPITYKDVAEVLGAIGEEAAGKLLEELSEKGATIVDPTGWLKIAANKLLSGDLERVALLEEGRPGAEPGAWISQTIEWLNNQGDMNQAIRYHDVAHLLAAIGDTASENLLQELSGKASTVKDPTNWLKAAASKLVPGGPASSWTAAGQGVKVDRMPGEDISQFVETLNREGGLSQPIRYSDVAELFATIGDSEAEKLLQDLVARGSAIKDPTGWLKAAAERVMSGRKPSGDKISKMIGWLNKQGVLVQPIMYKQVAEPLAAIGEDAAELMLQQLSQKASTIRDPTGWLKTGATKRLSGDNGGCGAAVQSFPVGMGGKGEWRQQFQWGSAAGKATSKGGSSSSGGNKAEGKGRELSELVSQEIASLNQSGSLGKPIVHDDIAGALSSIPEIAAIELLWELSEKAAQVEDPTYWLRSAVTRISSTNKRPHHASSSIADKVREINNYRMFDQHIVWDDVSDALLQLPEEKAVGLLEEVVFKAAEVQDPTEWLKSAAARNVKKPRVGTLVGDLE